MNKYEGMMNAAQELNARYLVAPYGVRSDAIDVTPHVMEALDIASKLVRCGECVFFDPSDALTTTNPDLRRCGWLKIAMTAEGYCSYGRRRDGGSD